MNKICFSLLLSFLSMLCFSQEPTAFNFDSYRTIHTDFVLDLTQENNIRYDREADHTIIVLAEQDEMHLGYFHFKLDKAIDSTETYKKSLPYTHFVQNLKQEIAHKNECLKKKKIKKAVSFENLIYTPILIKLTNNKETKYYKSQIEYQEVVF
ncbi:hypothetical protein [Myroides sp. TSA_177.3]|uniref:hypothetical protein n=1 Tax=Myroides sp. TSA_177.3 TaxID=3415650 RepID=UPI004046183E